MDMLKRLSDLREVLGDSVRIEYLVGRQGRTRIIYHWVDHNDSSFCLSRSVTQNCINDSGGNVDDYIHGAMLQSIARYISKLQE